jgi:hypothetical protein
MSAAKIDTGNLLKRLLNTNSVSRFVKQYADEFNRFPSFSEYVCGLCAEKSISAESVIKKASIHRTYGHKFFNGERTPSRDKTLQLAFGFGLSFDETQTLLNVARQSPLHPKVKRDVAIIYALKNGLGVTETQLILYDMGLSVLGKERYHD